MKLSLQSGSISKPDKTEQSPSPVAEGETRSRTAERLQDTEVSNFLSNLTSLSQLQRVLTQVSADKTGLRRRTASSVGQGCSM